MSVEAEISALLGELRSWTADYWDVDRPLRQWWAMLADAGWSRPDWPVGLGGRGLNRTAGGAINRELQRLDVLGPPQGNGLTMGAPTLLRHANNDQQHRFLPELVRGEVEWCQLFSEPGAGSDLASLRTTAVPENNGWVVNGQKVWSSRAHQSAWGMLLARTEPSAGKHDGISYFMIAMNQPGVVVRPLRQMNGSSEFNEVFLDGARVEDKNRIGAQGGGWKIAATTLRHERGAGRQRASAIPGTQEMLDLPVGRVRELVVTQDAQVPRMWGRTGRAMSRLASAVGRDVDPVLRDRIMHLYCQAEAFRFTAQRANHARQAGQPLPDQTSLMKLAASMQAHEARDIALDILGPSGMLAGNDAPVGGRAHLMAMSAHMVSIGGGTDEIQRNIIAEKMLGLPREPTWRDSDTAQ